MSVFASSFGDRIVCYYFIKCDYFVSKGSNAVHAVQFKMHKKLDFPST